MTNLIIEISKYFMIFMFAFYTYECFAAFRQKIKPEQTYFKQTVRSNLSDPL